MNNTFTPNFKAGILKFLFAIILLGLTTSTITAQDQGKVLFVGFNSDTDGFAVLAIAAIEIGEKLYFTNNEWDGSSFDNSGGIIEWTNTETSVINPGTVLEFNNIVIAPAVNLGTINSGSMDLSGSNETIWMLKVAPSAVDGSEDFISAITNEDDGANAPDLSNTGLSAGVNAAILDGDEDVMVYDGSSFSTTCNTDFADCTAQFTDPANWATDDGNGNEADDGTFPDYPRDVIASANILIVISGLPITLSSFDATIRNKQTLLNWTTDAEIDNQYMAIERSQDGRNFKELGRIAGAGTTEVPQNYSFTDKRPVSGLNYYRLRQVDFDGTATFSKVIVVELKEAKSDFSIRPTETADWLTVQMSSGFPQKGNLEIFDLNGRLLFQAQTDSGLSTLDINVQHFPSGQYVLRFVNGTQIETLRFFKR